MSYTMFCPKCNRNVQVKEVWDSKSLMTMILLLIAGLVPGVVYVLMKTVKGDECPNCGYTINMMKPPVVNEDGTVEDRPQNIKFCIFCDAAIDKYAEICPKCKNRVRRRCGNPGVYLQATLINSDALSIRMMVFSVDGASKPDSDQVVAREARP